MKAEKFLEALGEIDDKYIEEVRCYKMKKKFSVKRIVAVAACAALVIAAFPLVKNLTSAPANTDGTTATAAPVIKLGESGNFTVLEMDTTELGGNGSAINANHKVEFESATTSFIDEDKVDTFLNVRFQGLPVSGDYLRSRAGNYYGSNVDLYALSTNGTKFMINRDTGKCVYLSLRLPEAGDIKLTRDECFEIARNHFNSADYIEDPENYTLTDEHYFGNARMGYWFVFTRVIDGISTADDMKIFVSSYGEIYAYHAQMLGSMKNVDVSELDISAIEVSVKEKLEDIYADYAEFKYDMTKYELTRLADGSFAFECEVSVDIPETEENEKSSELCNLLVKIG